MDSETSMEQRVMKLEQQRGIAYAINLMGSLVDTMEDEITFRETTKA